MVFSGRISAEPHSGHALYRILSFSNLDRFSFRADLKAGSLDRGAMAEIGLAGSPDPIAVAHDGGHPKVTVQHNEIGVTARSQTAHAVEP